MKNKKTKYILFIGLIFILLILFFLVIIPLSFKLDEDVEKVNVEGIVYDKNSKEPLNGTKVTIENWMYEGGDYDGYGQVEKLNLVSNEKGFFSVELRKSAYLVVYLSKGGYLQDTVEHHAKRKVVFNVPLKKIK
jgi:hypothetical protein